MVSRTLGFFFSSAPAAAARTTAQRANLMDSMARSSGGDSNALRDRSIGYTLSPYQDVRSRLMKRWPEMTLAAGPVQATERTLRDMARPILYHYHQIRR